MCLCLRDWRRKEGGRIYRDIQRKMEWQRGRYIKLVQKTLLQHFLTRRLESVRERRLKKTEALFLGLGERWWWYELTHMSISSLDPLAFSPWELWSDEEHQKEKGKKERRMKMKKGVNDERVGWMCVWWDWERKGKKGTNGRLISPLHQAGRRHIPLGQSRTVEKGDLPLSFEKKILNVLLQCNQ